MNRRWIASGSATFLALGALAVGAVLVTSPDDDVPSSPPLLLVGAQTWLATAADSSPGITRPWTPIFETPGPLPSLEDPTPAYRVKQSSVSKRASDLARHLGVDAPSDLSKGSPNPDKPQLYLDNGAWFYSESAQKQGYASCSTSSPQSAPPTTSLCSGGPAPATSLPSDAVAVDTARAVFAAAGIRDIDLAASRDPWSVHVQATARVDGVEVATPMTVSLGENGRIVSAQGLFLGDLERVANYPRIGTAAALDLLRTGSAPGFISPGPILFSDSGASPTVAARAPINALDVPPSTMAVAPNPSASPVPITQPTSASADPADTGTTSPAGSVAASPPTQPPTTRFVDPPPRPTVVLEDVRSVLMMVPTPDRSVLLVPGYRFSGASHETFDVIALARSSFQEASPEVRPTPDSPLPEIPSATSAPPPTTLVEEPEGSSASGATSAAPRPSAASSPP